MLDKDKVKKYYLNGYNAVQIADILNAKVEAVRKCIQRNLKEFKNDHKIAQIRDKEILKITAREARQSMSDAEFIKRNSSIYKTNKNGDMVLDRKKSGTVPFDVPTRFNNEFSNERIDKKIKKSGYRRESELFV